MEDKSDLTFPDNSDSQGILVYYEIGSLENLIPIV